MIVNQKKNKLKTPGYFIKRLKDNDFITWRVFDKYSEGDPGGASVFITCFENTPFKGEYLFSFYDGNQTFNSNFSLKTDSIEVVVQKLIKSGVQQKHQSRFLDK